DDLPGHGSVLEAWIGAVGNETLSDGAKVQDMSPIAEGDGTGFREGRLGRVEETHFRSEVRRTARRGRDRAGDSLATDAQGDGLARGFKGGHQGRLPRSRALELHGIDQLLHRGFLPGLNCTAMILAFKLSNSKQYRAANASDWRRSGTSTAPVHRHLRHGGLSTQPGGAAPRPRVAARVRR